MSSSPGAYEPESTSGLDRHFNLPTIRHVPANRPLEWLRLGWRDFRRNTALSAIYGLVFALAGYELLVLAAAATLSVHRHHLRLHAGRADAGRGLVRDQPAPRRRA